MTTPAVDITIPDSATTLELGPGKPQGEFVFTAKNVLGRSFPGRAELIFDGPARPTWITVAEKHEFDLNGSLPVKVTANLGTPAAPGTSGTAGTVPGTGVRPGRYSFRLRISNSLNPNDEFSESRPVVVEVKTAVVHPLPAWLIPAILGGVLLIVGVVVAVVLGTRGLKLGDPCDPAASKCPKDIACHGEKKRCLAKDGDSCRNGNQCVSGKCTTAGKCGPALAVVTASPSCAGLAATCGPNQDTNCCATHKVPRGAFNRLNDPARPATVSAFVLDDYEVTVGRFRKFVAGYPANLPADGAGNNPSDPLDAGWDAARKAAMPRNAAVLRANLKCPGTSWTDEPGANENLPINCVTWLELQAFCIWDGGRLPTDAEWNYAAAGGNDQRTLPWSVVVGDTNVDSAHASIAALTSVGSKSPAGDGKWHHADLVGNVFEWTADGEGPIITPCQDCSSLSPGGKRSLRGGGVTGNPATRTTTGEFFRMVSDRDIALGGRCARHE